MQKAHLFRVTGRVQGVCFRAETKRMADALGLTGWVRNAEDGSVEVFAQGEEKALEKLEKWCSHGSAMARVQNVTREEVAHERLTAFEIRYGE